MQILTLLLAGLSVLAVCQAAGLPALAVGAGGVFPQTHRTIHNGLGSGSLSSHSNLHSSVVNSHHGSHGFSGLHSSVGSLGHGGIISQGSLHSSVGSLGHGGIISSGSVGH